MAHTCKLKFKVVNNIGRRFSEKVDLHRQRIIGLKAAFPNQTASVALLVAIEIDPGKNIYICLNT